ncbi:hypothetical protein LCGC14_1845000 [marine sediment metagenome]|uniref:Sulfatase N-terminal domain-containing protein n=1 Tax=marine sediment metagenome TaxID=412755 RepID=A0A0F9IRN2_9ZZZZ|nr:hypothetical protein [archaeon]
MSELQTIKCYLTQLPATILKLLDIDPPYGKIPEPIQQVLELYKGIERISINLIDNFGLFEITYLKPQFMIREAQVMLLLSTKNPYTLGVLHQLMYGSFDIEPNGFHLLKAINAAGKKSCLIGRKRDIERYDGGTKSIHKDSDMSTWVQSAQVINTTHLSWMHYLDFENLHKQQQQLKRRTPEDLIEKLLNRTDKWILGNYKQLRKNSLMIIIGDHGRSKLDLHYADKKITQWREASVPIAILIRK